MVQDIEDNKELDSKKLQEMHEKPTITSLDERLDLAESKIRRLQRDVLDVIMTLDNMRDKILRKIQTRREQPENPIIHLNRKMRGR